jgi:hypothetical protein
VILPTNISKNTYQNPAITHNYCVLLRDFDTCFVIMAHGEMNIKITNISFKQIITLNSTLFYHSVNGNFCFILAT